MTDDTRTRILRVALDLFVAQGFHATSVREIAQKLNLTKTAVLYHFHTKEDIVAALAGPMLADMDAAMAKATTLEQWRDKRWAVIEGLVDVWLAHRYLLRMSLQDLALASDGTVFQRFRDVSMLAQHLIAGPVADHHGRIRAAQAYAMLTDPIVIFADLPADMLRTSVLSGVERLLAEQPTARLPSRGRGRPGAMSPEMIETVRRLHASGEQSAAEIARSLGLSRATVYRHLS